MRYLAVLVYLYARQPLHQFLYGRALGRAVSRAVIYKGIFLDGHLESLSHHLGLFQQLGVGLHHYLAQRQVLALAYLYMLNDGLVAHARYAQDVLGVLGRLQLEYTLAVAQRSAGIGTVCV